MEITMCMYPQRIEQHVSNRIPRTQRKYWGCYRMISTKVSALILSWESPRVPALHTVHESTCPFLFLTLDLPAAPLFQVSLSHTLTCTSMLLFSLCVFRTNWRGISFHKSPSLTCCRNSTEQQKKLVNLDLSLSPSLSLCDTFSSRVQEYKTHKESYVKRFELTQLPPYLILYIKVCML